MGSSRVDYAKDDESIAISIRGLEVGFGGDSPILEDLDLDVRRGEVLGVVGGSGTGKSVLMRTIIGLNKAQAGEVWAFGEDFLTLSFTEQRRVERRWGVLFQEGALFTALTVAQNVQVPMREHIEGMPQELMDELASMKLSMVGLPPEAAPKYPSELSGGMKKRAGIARAIALDPEILFLDEPTAGLDPIGAAAFDELIARLHAALGLTVVMITHDLDSLNAICDRIAVLADKRVALVGTMDDMLQSDHPWIREYFHGPRSRAAGVGQR
ncbi:MAG: ATP-binding cassette domain-containing protein [Alphaproteobacteria bacterium]|nr:ATP-binding cassette domain-containing protein [Alphaproteobacteria bacterium]